ncbi:conserved hypothetical protein [Microsporum canis CBS 113480]|uniref:Endoglucanase n=1 Tax=Arthroderma otae (strain ATCC MYA-4605 / CBS 113480) TaxID=554155 RepID=C5G191_ARTOC|nr:conserved hypothetical protein [Microsporum canis CBS 113480]EEQ28554.1 conserved hypothetical protein [Microsporum canis CBS 113480]
MRSIMKTAALVGLLAASTKAHMMLYYPPTFGAENNPHRTDSVDPYLDNPYNCCGRKTVYPCRGYLDLLGTNQGAPVATWEAGSSQNFSLIGTGTHWGGSCQAGFSTDQGKSWKVISSYEGNCPHRKGSNNRPEEQTFEFKVPSDMPAGDHVFGWTWINREQEFFMSCSSVTITAPGKGGNSQSLPSYTPRGMHTRSTTSNIKSSAIAFNDRPDFLVANINNGCKTTRTNAEVKYPNPGPDVVKGDGVYPLELPSPTDKCHA